MHSLYFCGNKTAGNAPLSNNAVVLKTAANNLQTAFVRSKQRPFLTKPQLESDRQVPLMKMRHDHIRDVEYGLTQHPLALYPHLEEGMPPEVGAAATNKLTCVACKDCW